MRTVRHVIALLALVLAVSTAQTSHAQTKPATDTKVTIYHIEGSRGERIVWLCEELGIPYTLEVKRGDPAGSMQQIRSVNPGMPVSPTVRINDMMMVESGAIIEYLLAREGKGRLRPPADSAAFPYYLQWMHFAEGSLAARIFSDYRVSQLQNANAQPQGFTPFSGADTIKFVDAFLAKQPYFGGKEFSAADLMMHFPIMYSERLKMVKISDYPNLAAWQKRVEARPAYQRAVKVARPAMR